MSKIAAIISGADLNNRRGLMNAALTRIEGLESKYNYDIDVYAVTIEYKEPHTIWDIIRGEFEMRSVNFHGRKITLLVKIEYRSSNPIFGRILRYYHKYTLHRNSDWEWHKHFAGIFKQYRALTCHFADAAVIASEVFQKYRIPYFVTWHGSDIHTIPFNDEAAKVKIVSAIEKAEYNFFVSNNLMVTSSLLTRNGKKRVLYNGIDSRFYLFQKEVKAELRAKFNAKDKKVVTQAGNLRTIKNAQLLPDIFHKINDKYHGTVCFWVIGDGELRTEIERELTNIRVDYTLWGNQPYDKMPEFLNCTDVLILPSKNEGMPLISIEAIACGASAICSNVGGISESVGIENCVQLGEHFLDDFTEKVVNALIAPPSQRVGEQFNWDTTISRENEIYKSALG